MKNAKAPKPVVLAVLTLITVVFWIVFGIIRIISQPEPVDVPSQVIEPLTPELDTEILSTLEGRVLFAESEIQTQILVSTPTPVPLEITTPSEISATPSSELTPEESPTPTPSPSP